MKGIPYERQYRLPPAVIRKEAVRRTQIGSRKRHDIELRQRQQLRIAKRVRDILKPREVSLTRRQMLELTGRVCWGVNETQLTFLVELYLKELARAKHDKKAR